MNNEPVAWMNVNGQFNKKETWIFHIPLYTHPAKTLTDEEFISVYTTWSLTGNDPLVLKDAILKKASEK